MADDLRVDLRVISNYAPYLASLLLTATPINASTTCIATCQATDQVVIQPEGPSDFGFSEGGELVKLFTICPSDVLVL